MSNPIDSTLNTLKSSFDYSAIWNTLLEFLPSLVSAILLLLGGYFIAKVIAKIISKLLVKIGFDKLSEKAGLGTTVGNSGISTTPSLIFGKIIFWLIFLIFIVAASDALGLERVSEMINNFALYVPKLIGALLVAMLGLFAASLVRTGIETALGSINLGYEKAIGNVVYAVIVVVVISLAIGQLEIETDLLNKVVVIVLFAGAASLALALGLGTRDIAGNVVAGVYVREMCAEGDKVKIGDIVGRVIEVSSTSLIIQVDESRRVAIPNSRLIDKELEILS